MGEIIYVTDNAGIHSSLNPALSKGHTGPTFFHFPIDEFYTDKLMKNEAFSRLRNYKNTDVILYNAFMPTKGGQERFAYLMSKLDFEHVEIRDLSLHSAKINEYTVHRTSSLKGLEEKELTYWLKSKINAAIEKSLNDAGFPFPYDCMIFPLLEEIRKRKILLNDEKQCKSKAKLSIRIGQDMFSGELCNQDGKVLKLPPEEIHLDELIRIGKGEVIRVEKTEVEVPPPPLYNYLDLLEELSESPIRLVDKNRSLFQLYREKMLSFPETTDRTLCMAVKNRMITANQVNFPPYDDFTKALRFREPSGIKDSEMAGGITLMSAEKFKEEYGKVKKTPLKYLYDLLLRRQLVQYATAYKGEKVTILVKFGGYNALISRETVIDGGWKTISEGLLPEDKVQVELKQEALIVGADYSLILPQLHNAKSIIRLLKLNAAGSNEEIAIYLDALEKYPFVHRYHNYYLLHRDDEEKIDAIPDELKSMDIYGKIHQSCKRALSGKLSKEEYMRIASEEIAKYCEEKLKEVKVQ